MQLANDAEEIALIELLDLGVKTCDRLKIGQVEFAAQAFDAASQHIQRAALFDLIGETVQKMGLGLVRCVSLELFPFFWLRDKNEIEYILWEETERFVILAGRAFVITARDVFAIRNSDAFAQRVAWLRVVRPACQQEGFDRGFKILLGDVNHLLPCFLAVSGRLDGFSIKLARVFRSIENRFDDIFIDFERFVGFFSCHQLVTYDVVLIGFIDQV
jgi:hypothetical protein